MIRLKIELTELADGKVADVMGVDVPHLCTVEELIAAAGLAERILKMEGYHGKNSGGDNRGPGGPRGGERRGGREGRKEGRAKGGKGA